MDTTEIREKLKCSLEIAHIRSSGMIFTIIFGAYIALMTLSWGGWVTALILGGVLLVPIWCWHGWRAWKIFRSPGAYVFCKAKLSQPHSSAFFRAFYFTIVLETPERGTFAADTHAIFQPSGWLGPIMEDYVNRDVTIAYNEETGQVVVIG